MKTTKTATAKVQPYAAKIAREILDLGTLETRRMDSLDFHELAVWEIREALEAAYNAGRDAAAKAKKPLKLTGGMHMPSSIPEE